MKRRRSAVLSMVVVVVVFVYVRPRPQHQQKILHPPPPPVLFIAPPSTPPPQLASSLDQPLQIIITASPLPLPPSPPPPSPPSRLMPSAAASVAWKLRLDKRQRDDTDFAGSPSLEERKRVLGGCLGRSKCGFMRPSGYDALAAEAARLSRRCSVVIATAVFGKKDKLQQPQSVPSELRNCYFAIVDQASAAFVAETAPKSIKRAASANEAEPLSKRIGAWQLLTLSLASSPYPQPRRASRVPKLLPFRLFPTANFSLWVDGKLKLLSPPMELVQRFLLAPKASLALARNLRRSHIDEEMRWIRAALASEPQKLKAGDADAVEKQWRFYLAERRNQSGNAGADGGDGEAEWTKATACAEGAMIVSDLRSSLARCVLCAWFNEWHMFGERDQLSLSYVLHAMGITPPMDARAEHDAAAGSPPSPKQRKHQLRAHRGVYLWPRREHWNYKRRSDEPKQRPYVRYMGHGGCVAGGTPNPGCPGAPNEAAKPSQTSVRGPKK